MTVQVISSIDDPRVAVYRQLIARSQRGESVFVTEGAVLTKRLLASGYPVDSVFITESHVQEFSALTGESIPLFVAAPGLMNEILGFKFHQGVLGAGIASASKTVEQLFSPASTSISSPTRSGGTPTPMTFVICPEITKPENLGLIFRTAAGFGFDGVILGDRCGDPLSRRCLRVSMGGVLRVPFARSTDLASDLRWLKEHQGLTLVGAVLNSAAVNLDGFHWPDRAAILIGNETAGIEMELQEKCDFLVTIPMVAGTDSLNLGVAAGIFMNAMRK